MNNIATLPSPNAGESLELYLQSIQQIPILNAEEELQLAKGLRENNDLSAARQLILSQLRFVVYIARGYSGYGLSQADLIQEGNIGLMKAVKRFDPAFNVRLISFSVHWIRAEIHEFILKNWRIVKVATTKAQRKLFFNLRSAKKYPGWLNKYEIENIAKDLKVSKKDILEMESRMSAHDMSFNAINDDDGMAENWGPENYLAHQSPDPETSLINSQEHEQRTQRLVNGLHKLNERERDIIKRRWLTEHKSTLGQLAEEYQISAERVRQIEQSAIKKIQRNVLQ